MILGPLGLLLLLTAAGGSRWSNYTETETQPSDAQGFYLLYRNGSTVAVGEAGKSVEVDQSAVSVEALGRTPLAFGVSESGLTLDTSEAGQVWLLSRDQRGVVFESPTGQVMWVTGDGSDPIVKQRYFGDKELRPDQPTEVLGLSFEFIEFIESSPESAPPPQSGASFAGLGDSIGLALPLAVVAGLLMVLGVRRFRRTSSLDPGSSAEAVTVDALQVGAGSDLPIPAPLLLDRAEFMGFVHRLEAIEPRAAIKLATDFLEQGPGRIAARLENETAIEWHGRVGHLKPDLRQSHGLLIDRFVVAKFSAMEVTEADRTQAIGALVDLYNSSATSSPGPPHCRWPTCSASETSCSSLALA